MLDSIAPCIYRADYLYLKQEHKSLGLQDKETSDSDSGKLSQHSHAKDDVKGRDLQTHGHSLLFAKKPDVIYTIPLIIISSSLASWHPDQTLPVIST